MSDDPNDSTHPRRDGSDLEDLSQRPEIQALIRREEARRPIEGARDRAMDQLRNTRRDRRPFLLVSQAVIVCPTRLKPGRPEKGEHHYTSTGRLPSGDVVQVEYASRVQAVGVLGGKDEALFDGICARFLKRGSPCIEYGTAAALMDELGLVKRYQQADRSRGAAGGFRFRELNDRLARIAATVMTLRRPGIPAVVVRVVDVDAARLHRDVVALERAGQRRLFPYVLRLAPEFYEDLLRWRFRVPQAVIRTFASNPTEYRVAKWLLYRSTWGAPTEIPLDEIIRERGSTDRQLRRVRGKVLRTLQLLIRAWPLAEDVFHLQRIRGYWRLRLNPHRAQEHLIPGPRERHTTR